MKAGELYRRIEPGRMMEVNGVLYVSTGKQTKGRAQETWAFKSVATGRVCNCYPWNMQKVENIDGDLYNPL